MTRFYLRMFNLTFFFSGFTYSLIEFDHLVNYLTSENYLVRY